MNCTRCSVELPPQAMFCPHCGGPAWGADEFNCPACSHAVALSDKFCAHCGFSLRQAGSTTSASSIRPEPRTPLHRLGPREYVEQLLSRDRKMSSERRIVTILFADVVGSTTIADTMDPEDVAEIMNGALSVLTEPIGRHEGTLARLMGDAVLCFFGAPVAHENDPHHACQAALDILSGAERYAAELNDRYQINNFKVRVGVSTGLAVVGEVGTQDRAEYTAMGDAVNLASRLQAAAEPGTALIAAETWSQVNAAFEAEDRGTLAVRGKAAPVRIFQLLRKRATGTPASSEASVVPMVGRELELAHLREAIKSAPGRGVVILVIGDDGIGKSRLIAEARRGAPDEFTWFVVKCRASHQFVGYAAVRDLLHALLGTDDSVPHAAVIEKLDQMIQPFVSTASNIDSRAVSVESVRTALSILLRVSIEDRPPRGLNSGPVSDIQQCLQNSVSKIVEIYARRTPLVIMWEDLHWIDQESLAVLQMLGDVVLETPLILLFESRRGSERVSRIVVQLKERCGSLFKEIPIGPLTRGHSQLLLQRLMVERSIAPDQADRILQITEGNPFFLEQMARGMSAADLSDDSLPIPPTVQAAILARVDRLSPRDKQVLLMTAIAGRCFPRVVVEHVLADKLSPTELAETLDSLERRGFLERADGSAPSAKSSRAEGLREELRFVQAMTHEVVYESVLRSDRKLGHRKIAESLEALYPSELGRLAPDLMRHFDAADDLVKAAGYAQLTGDRAVKLHALDNALELYRRSLEYLSRIPATLESAALERGVLERIADAHFLRAEYEDATAAYESALVKSASAHECADLRRKIALVQEKRGRYDEARISYENALSLLEGDPNVTIAAQIYAGLCLVHYHQHDLTKAAELGERAMAMTQQSEDRRAHAEACNELAIVCAASGEIGRARTLYNECRRIWSELGDDYGLASCFNNLGCLAKTERRWSDAIREFGISLELFTALGNRHAIARVCDNMAETYYLKGDQNEAEQHMARAVALLSEIGMTSSGIQPEMWQSGIW